jgi:hypothetical protein
MWCCWCCSQQLHKVLTVLITTAHLPSDNTLPMEYSTANLVICNVHRNVRDCKGRRQDTAVHGDGCAL